MKAKDSLSMIALDEALACVGGLRSLASGLGIGTSTPAMWKSRGSVPAEYCPGIERMTRERGAPVTCERLRPDVDWAVLRSKSRRRKQSAEA